MCAPFLFIIQGGRMDGHGVKTMANGDSYEGEWKNDKANGRGCKTFACGDRHEGECSALCIRPCPPRLLTL